MNKICKLKPITGIYILYFDNHDTIYIGASRDITKRLNQHKLELDCNRHLCKELNDDYFRFDGNLKVFVIEQCDYRTMFKKEFALTKILKQCGVEIYNNLSYDKKRRT